MDVFLMVRRKKTTMFLDAKDTTTVLELKKMIEGITKRAPADQRLYNKDDEIMEDDSQLQECGITNAVAKAQLPAEVGLAFRSEFDGAWEDLEKVPYSNPPELPDVMKPGQETSCQPDD